MRCAFPLAGLQQQVAATWPGRPGARAVLRQGAGPGTRGPWQARVCDTLPPTAYFGPGGRRRRRSPSFLWSLSLPGFLLQRCADRPSLKPGSLSSLLSAPSFLNAQQMTQDVRCREQPPSSNQARCWQFLTPAPSLYPVADIGGVALIRLWGTFLF